MAKQSLLRQAAINWRSGFEGARDDIKITRADGSTLTYGNVKTEGDYNELVREYNIRMGFTDVSWAQEEFIDEELMQDIYGAYSIMSMNAIYYRFTHLASEADYFTMPANLRMQYLSKFKIDKSDFEMLCLAVAVIIGCGKCINAHENILRENNISKLHIQTVARVASVINSIANVIIVLK